jgi:hypothetical protein
VAGASPETLSGVTRLFPKVAAETLLYINGADGGLVVEITARTLLLVSVSFALNSTVDGVIPPDSINFTSFWLQATIEKAIAKSVKIFFIIIIDEAKMIK